MTTCKKTDSTPDTNHFKGTRCLNVKCKTINILEENIKENLCDLEFEFSYTRKKA